MAEEDIKTDINESKEGSEVNESENEGDESENTQQNGDSQKNGDSQENGESSEDDISESEPSPKKKKGVALLDAPVEQSGKRARTKTTELYVVEKKEEKVFEYNGSGIALEEVPFILDMIDNKKSSDDLRKLHNICFGGHGKKTTLKKTLRKFNGYTFDKSDAKFAAKQTNMEKINISELKSVCSILGLERGGIKSDLVLRILEFVIKPYDHKKEVEKNGPGRKKKRSKSSKKKEGGKKRKRSDAGKPRAKKSKGDEDKENDSTANGDSTADEENDDSTANGDDSTANEDSTANDSASSNSDSGTEGNDYEAEKKPKKTPAKKAVKTPAKKVASKTPAKKVASKTPAKKTPAKKTPAKKTPAKKTPLKSVQQVVDSDSSDDDEPLVKKKKVAPTNDEIKKKVEKILDGADLEEVTMKKVCQQIYDLYPGFDITDRKSLIKETVREIIS